MFFFKQCANHLSYPDVKYELIITLEKVQFEVQRCQKYLEVKAPLVIHVPHKKADLGLNHTFSNVIEI